MMRVFIAMAFLLLLTACGSSPKTHFFTLDPAPGSADHAAGWHGSPIEVGGVQLPATLDRLSMVTQGPGEQLNVSDQNRWGAPLDALVRRALTDDLRARLPQGAVLEPGDSTRHNTRVLALNVQRFIGDASGGVVLEADWSVERDGNSGDPHHVRIEEQASGLDGSGVAEAMSRALGKLADQVSRSLA